MISYASTLHFSNLQSITGITLAQANTSAFINATINAICSATGTAYNSVHIVSITDAGRRRILLQSGGVIVKYTVTSVNGNAASLTSSIGNAVNNGIFTSSLRNSGYSTAEVNKFPNILHYSVSLHPTQSPTQSPTQVPTFTTDTNSSSSGNKTVIISVLSSIGALATGLLLFWQYKKSMAKPGSLRKWSARLNIVTAVDEVEIESDVWHRVRADSIRNETHTDGTFHSML